MNIDGKSIAIIKAKYWRNGWVDSKERHLTPEDASHLADHGWDLGAIKKSHDELVNEIVEMSKAVNIRSCTVLLSGSLTSRQLQYRSYLSSALQSKKLPVHSHTTIGRCPVCGLYAEETIDQDVLVFEKIMWGGVRLTHMSYVWFDLKLLKNVIESSNGIKELEDLVRELSTDVSPLSASKFSASLKMIKGNKAEREVLCGILGVCDILQNPDHPGFLRSYVAVNERELPDQHYIDLEWPFCWYNRKFGVNLSAIDEILSDRANKSHHSQP